MLQRKVKLKMTQMTRVEVCSEGGKAHAMDYTARQSQLITNHGH